MTPELTAAKQIEKFLHDGIPLSRQMKVEVTEIDVRTATLRAPLDVNINHHSTVFGGSLHAVCLLACWSLVAHVLRTEGLESDYVVVQDSQIDYKLPVDTDFTAHASWAVDDDRDIFVTTLKRHGRARATIRAEIRMTDTGMSGVAAVLTGRFAARLLSHAQPKRENT